MKWLPQSPRKIEAWLKVEEEETEQAAHEREDHQAHEILVERPRVQEQRPRRDAALRPPPGRPCCRAG
jgi:hypothetical protein